MILSVRTTAGSAHLVKICIKWWLMFKRYFVVASFLFSMLLQGCEHLYDTLSSDEFTRAVDDFHKATAPPKPKKKDWVVSRTEYTRKYDTIDPTCMLAASQLDASVHSSMGENTSIRINKQEALTTSRKDNKGRDIFVCVLYFNYMHYR